MEPATRLYPVGIMASGKTTVGLRAAEALQFQFLATDTLMEAAVGMEVTEAFVREGERGFRQREWEAQSSDGAGST